MSIIALALLASGLFFMGVTVLGLLRLPDFFTRVHAVSKSETLGTALVLLALIVHRFDTDGDGLITRKDMVG